MRKIFSREFNTATWTNAWNQILTNLAYMIEIQNSKFERFLKYIIRELNLSHIDIILTKQQNYKTTKQQK